MEILVRELHYRWLDTPSESVVLDEIPDPQPPPHPQPTDPPPTAVLSEDEEHSSETILAPAGP